jgi:pantothenate kinase type III
MSLLAADIGNSHTVLGLLHDGEVSHDWRVASSATSPTRSTGSRSARPCPACCRSGG